MELHREPAPLPRDLDHVRIVDLPACRVAVAHAFAHGPEAIAWAKLSRFARSLPELPEGTRWFGFNSPDPQEPGQAYGYEQWMTVPIGVHGAGEVHVQRFAGGCFAALRCTLATLPRTWQRLLEWAAQSGVRLREGPMLEECLRPPLDGQIDETLPFDLLLPIERD